MKFLSKCGAVLAALFLCPVVHAAGGGQVTVDTNLPIPAAAAYSSTFAIITNGINWGAAQVVVSSVGAAGPVGGTFYSGSASTGNLTVASYLALSSATAATSLTISSDTALVGSCVSGGGPNNGSFNVCNPANFAVDLNYSSNTAINIVNAIRVSGVVIATAGISGANSTVFYASSTYGASVWNSFDICTSTYNALVIANVVSSNPVTGVGCGHMIGGQDNQTFTINGQLFTANAPLTAFGFYPMTSTAVTATNIATAITASSNTTGVIANAGNTSTTVVYETATVNGSNTNYVVISSSQQALSVSNPVVLSSGGSLNLLTIGTGSLTGGTTASWLVNFSTITLSGNTLGQGEAVSLPTGVGGAITGLANGGTYYIMDIPANTTSSSVMLASNQLNAVNNVPIVLTSSAVVSGSPIAYTLTPLPLLGTPSFQWMVSDDGVHYSSFTTTAFGQNIGNFGGYGVYYATGTVSTFDFGHIDHGWLGLQYTAPTQGALNIVGSVTGKQN